MTSRGNKSAVTLGPGYLFIAPLGTDEPTDDPGAAFPTGWVPLGYTDNGTTQTYEPSYDDVTVAEEIDPIDSAPTGRKITVAFDLAENTALNYKRALNGGTVTVVSAEDATPIVTKYEPPDFGTEVCQMIGWQSEAKDELWVWRQCKQTGSVATNRQKGATKATIPTEFTCYPPDAGGRPFMRLSNRTGEAAS
jgi:hypothetical protein